MPAGKRTIGLVIDNPKRDLRGVALLAYALAREGRSSVIVPMYTQGYDMPLLSCENVVLNYLRLSNQELVRTYRDVGMHVSVLDTEGGILSRAGLREPHNWARNLRETGLIDLVDDYFFWGDAVRQAFARESGLREEQLHLTGCPRYDLCSPPWNAALTFERKGYVLVNTNFSAINPAFTRSSFAEKRIFCSLGWDATYVDTWFTEMEALFPRYQDAVAELARAFPSETVLVRPHPFENEDVYRQRFAEIPNIVVDGRGDALNMIANAACIVHLNCGTAVDALLQRKPAISLEYLNTDLLQSHTPLPSRVSIRAASFEALVEEVSARLALPGEFVVDGARAEVEPWFYKDDGGAAERVAQVLAGLPARSVSRNVGAALRGGRHNASAGQIAQGAANVVAGSRFVTWVRSRLDRSRRGKAISVAQVQSLLDTFAQCCNGPRFRAAHARNPLTGLPMSSIEVRSA